MSAWKLETGNWKPETGKWKQSPQRVIPSGARNLLLLFFTVTSRFLVASLLGMTGLG